MTAMPEHPSAPDPGAAGGDDPTRDIRLPLIPGRAAPALPEGWAPPAAVSAAEEAHPASAEEHPTPSLVNQRTDELSAPRERPRERTLAFSAPEMRHRPIGPVNVGRSPRRWPWFVLAALPVLIIVGTGIWLLLLLRAA
jgi:hypothetical protein